MKKFNAFLLCGSILFMSSASTTDRPYNSKINLIEFNFENDENNIIITFDYLCSYDLTDGHSNIKVDINDGTSGFSYAFHDEYDVNYTYEISKCCLKNGTNKIFVMVQIEDRVYIAKTIQFTYYDDANTCVVNLRDDINYGNVRYIKCENSVFVTYYEKFIIEGCNEMITSPVYYRIDLNSLRVRLPNVILNDDYVAMLKIKCDKKYFPRLSYYDDEKCFMVPLRLVHLLDDYYRLVFKTLFYEENTLMMSQTSGDYFKRTNAFYLPPNHFEDLRELPLEIILSNVGRSHFEMNYPFSYVSDLAFMGDCVTSGYCVTTSGGTYA